MGSWPVVVPPCSTLFKAAMSPLEADPRINLCQASILNRMPPPPSSAGKPVKNNSYGTSQRPNLEAVLRSLSQPPSMHLGMFEIGRPLGKGKFGRVYLAKHRESGFVCALKVLHKREIQRDRAEIHVRREIEVHSNLRHAGVVGFYSWFHDTRRIFLVIEYAAGGELYKILSREGRFSERRSAVYAAQVAQSLNYLHRKNIMHRDLKPENILVGLHGELKLADFGYSVHAPSNRRETLCGTLDYLPPEMLTSGKVNYSRAIDQWTLGVLTYEFLVGKAPFEDSQAMTRIRIVQGAMTALPSSLSPEAKDFVHSVWAITVALTLPAVANMFGSSCLCWIRRSACH